MSRAGRALHYLFGASLIAKGAMALTESLSGLGLLLMPNVAIAALVDWLAARQVTESALDPLAGAAQHLLAALPLPSQHFYALYLLAHGTLKLAMVLALARRWPAAYPAAMVLLSGFVAYQGIEFWHGGAPVLGLLAVLDAGMMALVWREYRALPRQPAMVL